MQRIASASASSAPMRRRRLATKRESAAASDKHSDGSSNSQLDARQPSIRRGASMLGTMLLMLAKLHRSEQQTSPAAILYFSAASQLHSSACKNCRLTMHC